MPIALDLLPSFWKSLREERLDLRDLQEADCITYNLTQKMLDVRMCVGVLVQCSTEHFQKEQHMM